MKPLLSERNCRWEWGRGKWGDSFLLEERKGTPDRQTLEHIVPYAHPCHLQEASGGSRAGLLSSQVAHSGGSAAGGPAGETEAETGGGGLGGRVGPLTREVYKTPPRAQGLPRTCSLSLLCPGRHAADGSRAGAESAAGRAQRYAGSTRELKHEQEFLDPTLPGSVGTTVVTMDPGSLRELSLFIKVLDHLCTHGPSQSVPLSRSKGQVAQIPSLGSPGCFSKELLLKPRSW